MVVLGAVILSLACVFMGYCVLHFERELARSRNKVTCYGLSTANPRGGAAALETRGKVVELRAASLPVGRQPDSQFAQAGSSEYANTILALGRSRLAVVPSRTARLVRKRAAKG